MRQPDGSIAHVLHAAEIVGNQHDGATIVAELHELLEATLLKGHVADREDLVHDEQPWIHVDRDSKCESHIHTRRVRLHRGIDKALESRELDDLVEAAGDLAATHAQNCRVQEDVFSSR